MVSGAVLTDNSSIVLTEFGLEDPEYLFWKYFYLFLINYAVLVIIEFILFTTKAKQLLNIPFSFGFNSLKTKNDDSIEMKCLNEIQDINYSTFSQFIEETNEVMIAWIDMTLNIERKGLFKSKSIPILNEISGGFRKNTLNTIMGPSGAGKTTLLKCLNGRTFSII